MKQKIHEKISKTVLLSSLFGLLTAVVGTFFIFSFLAPAAFFNKSIDTESQNQEFLKTSLGIKAYGRLEVFEFLDKSLPALAGVYKKLPDSFSLVDRSYVEADRLGYGMVLTTDGWILSNEDALAGYSSSRISVLVQGRVYDVESVVRDSWTNLIFMKVDAEDLPVVPLGDSDNLNLGDIVFTGTGKDNFWFSYVNGAGVYPPRVKRSDIILSSEEFGKIIELKDSIPIELNGSMASNKDGEVVGMVIANKADHYILPVNYFKNIISDVLKNSKVSRPYFGVNYVDLSSVNAKDLPNERGAYVYGGGILRSVALNSPADKAEIATGDIILSVDGELIGTNKNLSEILAEYRVGDEVLLRVLREDEEREVSVVLGSS